MRERTVERRLKLEIEKLGGMCLKFTSPGVAGVPDRIVLLPGGRTVFVELKSPTGKPSPIQIYRFGKFGELGHKVYVINSIEGVKEFILFVKLSPDGGAL